MQTTDSPQQQLLFSFLSGTLFGVGLALSGMTQPDKVIGFLDLTGSWDPSLAFVMGGALLLHWLLYPLVTKRERPVAATKFQIPQRSDITGRLLLGSALFGVGWGLGGFCPGPALTSTIPGSLDMSPVLVFIPSMLLGMFIFNKADAALATR